VKLVQTPPQLSFNFDHADSCRRSFDHLDTETVDRLPSFKFRVVDLSCALSKKQEARVLTLYRQILDSVKHLR
jgi:hypothetical protein